MSYTNIVPNNNNMNGLNNSYGNALNNSYGNSYGNNVLNNSYGNNLNHQMSLMSLGSSGGLVNNGLNNINTVNRGSIPAPPPLPSQPLYNNNMGSMPNLRTRDWGNPTNIGWSNFNLNNVYSLETRAVPTQIVTTMQPVAVAQQPVQSTIPAGMLPAPINDGRRYARLTGQKGRSNRARRQLVQPLNQTGLPSLPAGVPAEGLAVNGGAGYAPNTRRSRRVAKRNRRYGITNNNVMAPPMSAQPMMAQPMMAQPMMAQPMMAQPMMSQPMMASAVPLVQQPVQSTIPSGMLPAPINDGRRYARLTGQKGRSNRARNQLVQPLNQTGLSTLPAGVPAEGLASAAAGGRRRRTRRSAGFNNRAGFGGQSMMAQPMMGQPMMQPMMGQPMMAQPMMGQSVMAQPMMAQPTMIGQPVTTSFVNAAGVPMMKQEYTTVTQQPMMGQAAF